MAKGFLSGVIWGGALGVVALGAVSVWDMQMRQGAPTATDRPAANAPIAQTPVANAPQGAAQPGSPRPAAQQPVAPAQPGGLPQTGDNAGDRGAVLARPVLQAPKIDASPALAPGLGLAAGRSTTPGAPAQPVGPNVPNTLAPGAVVMQTAPVLGRAPAEDPAKDPTEIAAQSPAEMPSEQPAPSPSPSVQSAAPVQAQTSMAPASTAPVSTAPVSTTPAPQGDGTAPAPAPGDALPQPSGTAPKPQSAQAVVQPVAPPRVMPETGAIKDFAQAFDNPNGKPLMSIVLIDDGKDLSDVPIGMTALRSFRYPLTVAVDVRLPDASRRMARHRAEGYEVVALGDLNGDAKAHMAQALGAVPEAVAILDPGLRASAAHVPQLATLAAISGRALIGGALGPDFSGDQAAIASVFKDFDKNDETPNAIRRTLDEAAQKAARHDGVIVLGRLRSDTITALLIWGLQTQVERVALAPVSALLQDRLGAQE